MGLIRNIRTLREFFHAGALSREYKEHFKGMERFVMFIGYPRSSHSLIGSLIDAHPNAIIAHEQDTLRYVKYGFSKDRILSLLLENSHAQTKEGRSWTGYSYQVSGQYQGIFTKLRVIGDKKGANSTRRLQRDPELLNHLASRMGVPVHLIHITRHPLDNITTMAIRKAENGSGEVDQTLLRNTMEQYFKLADGIARIREKGWESSFIDLPIERFLAEPRAELRDLLESLHLPVDENYLEDCASILFEEPKRTRDRIDWPESLRKETLERSGEYSFLRTYLAGDQK